MSRDRLALGHRRWPAGRWVVDLADGSTAFAKVGTTENTANWLRTEHETYRPLTAGFMPRLLGWDDVDAPILLLEDLSGAVWPPADLRPTSWFQMRLSWWH
jgi:hypothetical protein